MAVADALADGEERPLVGTAELRFAEAVEPDFALLVDLLFATVRLLLAVDEYRFSSLAYSKNDSLTPAGIQSGTPVHGEIAENQLQDPTNDPDASACRLIRSAAGR